jgi:hypothetical protein
MVVEYTVLLSRCQYNISPFDYYLTKLNPHALAHGGGMPTKFPVMVYGLHKVCGISTMLEKREARSKAGGVSSFFGGSTIFAPVQLARLVPNSLNACHISNNPH